MYAVTVRGHVMIAHSLEGEFFGPAQALHGATYVIDAEFSRAHLDAHDVVLDIGVATRILSEVTESLNYQNLDVLDVFHAQRTTTEFLARYIHDALRERLGETFKGCLKVTLHESHLASASYLGPEG